MKTIHPKTLKVGDKFKQYVHFDKCPTELLLPGEVVWVHPEKRYYRMKFQLVKGVCYESYKFYGKHSGLTYSR